MASGDSEEELVIALIGKVGVGKSSTGKTLVGRNVFKSGISGSPVTLECQCESSGVNGRTLRVVDSPGLNPSLSRSITTDIVQLAKPGLHAILVCIRFGRFTEEDHTTIEEAKKWFGRNMARHLIIVFTSADQLEDEVTEEEFIQTVPPNLRDLLELVDNRYLTVSNRLPGGDSTFVQSLLDMVEDNVRRIGGVRYTEEDFIQATEDIDKKELQDRHRAELKRRRERDEIEISFKNKCARLMEEVQLLQVQKAEVEERKFDQAQRNDDEMVKRKHRLMRRHGYSQQWRNMLLKMVRNEERRNRDMAFHRARIMDDLRKKEAALEDMKRQLEAERAANRVEMRRSEERQRRAEQEHKRRLAAIDAEIQQSRTQAQNDNGPRRR